MLRLAILLLLPFAAIDRLALGGETNGPVIACDAPVFDFGEHDNGSDIEHVFTIRNSGTGPLTISKVRAGCGCTKVLASTNVVPPGGTAQIETRVCIRGYKGLKKSTIYIHSNDPTQSIFPLVVMGVAVADVDIDPRTVQLQARTGERLPEAKVTVVNRSPMPMHITGWQCTSAFFSAVVTTNDDGRNYSVCIRVAGNTLSETCQGTMTLLTDHPRYPSLDIPVSAALLPEMVALPSQILIQDNDDQKPLTRYVILRSTREREFRVTGIDTKPAGISAGVQSAKPTWVRIRIGPFMPDSSMTNGMVTINTDLAGAETIRIPVQLIQNPVKCL